MLSGAAYTGGAVSRTTLSSGQVTRDITSVRGSHIEDGKPRVEGVKIEKSLEESTDNVSISQVIKKKEKSDPVKSACLHCRRRKAKCSGERPVCRPCVYRDLECQWQAPEGLTRSEGLKRELQSVTSRTDDLKMLIGGMRAGSDEEATTLLARLRLGDSLEELAHTAKTVLGQSETERPSPRHKPGSIPNTDKD
jgi:hypothetical protein